MSDSFQPLFKGILKGVCTLGTIMVFASFTGCNNEDNQKTPEVEETPQSGQMQSEQREQMTSEPPARQESTVQDVRQQWSQAISEFKAYSAEQSDQAVAKAKEIVDDMGKHIEQLEARAKGQWDQMSEEARDEQQQMMAHLKEQQNELAEWYGNLQESSAATWENAKQGFVRAQEKVATTFHHVMKRIDSAMEGKSG